MATDRQRLTRFKRNHDFIIWFTRIRHASKRQVERARVTQKRVLYALHTSDKNSLASPRVLFTPARRRVYLYTLTTRQSYTFSESVAVTWMYIRYRYSYHSHPSPAAMTKVVRTHIFSWYKWCKKTFATSMTVRARKAILGIYLL